MANQIPSYYVRDIIDINDPMTVKLLNDNFKYIRLKIFGNLMDDDLDSFAQINGNKIKANSITANQIDTSTLIVGDNIQMGANAVLTWDMLSDESKANLTGPQGIQGIQGPIGPTGPAGSDANVPSWVTDWTTKRTQIGSNYVVSPFMFAGTGGANATGIALGCDAYGNYNSSVGIVGYQNGVAKFQLNTDGTASFAGDVFSGKTITGAKLKTNLGTIYTEILDSRVNFVSSGVNIMSLGYLTDGSNSPFISMKLGSTTKYIQFNAMGELTLDNSPIATQSWVQSNGGGTVAKFG